jgi:uncharacterized protein YndB with AHSA1/START domain
MTTHTGYLLIADISGYTAYLTASEQEHANPILRSLLTALVEQVGDPLHLWRMEGDAVLAYSTRQEFPSGEGFLSICENLYNSFATRRRNIIANTTCDCRACANVEGLDLKIMAHHGSFEEMQIGPMKDISGADVILVHRMAKTDVKAKTGIASYALFTEAAVKAMDINTALVSYSESFEHFGETPMKVYDLAKAWEGFREREERHFLEEADGVWTYRHHVAHPPPLVWEGLVNPELKRKWMDMRSVSVDRPSGRIGPSSGYHCVHEAMEFKYWVTDWHPFRYFSTTIGAPMDPSQKQRETYELIPTETGTEIRYTCSELLDESGVRQEENEAAIIEFLAGFWPPAFDALEELISSWT